GNNKGLAKIKKEAEAKKKQQAITPSENKQLEVHQVQEIKTSSNVERQSRGRTKKVGAPIRKFDKVYSTKHPLKLSTLLNGFCCKVFQKIYFSVKLRKKTERTE
ncbi:hypothetical protein OKE_05187, partial [Enterococcus faecium EnGen0043]